MPPAPASMREHARATASPGAARHPANGLLGPLGMLEGAGEALLAPSCAACAGPRARASLPGFRLAAQSMARHALTLQDAKVRLVRPSGRLDEHVAPFIWRLAYARSRQVALIVGRRPFLAHLPALPFVPNSNHGQRTTRMHAHAAQETHNISRTGGQPRPPAPVCSPAHPHLYLPVCTTRRLPLPTPAKTLPTPTLLYPPQRTTAAMSHPTPVPGIVYGRIDQIWNTTIPSGSLVCAVRTPVHQLVIDCCPEVSGELRFVDDQANCLIGSQASAAPFAACLNKRDKEGMDYGASVCTASPAIVPDMDPAQARLEELGKQQVREGQSRFSESWAKHGFTSPLIAGGPPGQLSQATQTALPNRPDPIPGVDFDPVSGEAIAVADDGAKSPAPGAAPASAARRTKRRGTVLALAALALVVVTM